MRKLLLALALGTGALLAALLFQQLAVEGSFGPAAMVAAAGLGGAFVALLLSWVLLGTRYREAVQNVWLAVVSVTVTYLVLDLIAGYVLIRPLSPPLVPDAARHHRLVPDSYAEFNQRDFSYLQRVNRLGLRGREVEARKAPGTYRIVMLGDSFTMGKGVRDEETFSAVLEQALQKNAGACGRPIEVLNGGVDSYAPVLQYIQLTRDIAPLDPDMVVVNLDNSDLVQEAAYRSQAERAADGTIVAVPQHAEPDTPLERIRIWTERHLFFTRAAFFYANRALGYRELNVREVVTRADAEVLKHTLEGDIDRTAQWRDIFDSITRMKRFADERGIQFLLTVYPWAHQISDTEWLPGRAAFLPAGARPSDLSRRTVHALAEANGVPLLDLFPTFTASLGRERLYFDYDMHWTAAGHRVMASGLETYLVQRLGSTWCR
jgi:lysophospholipase L1-like esterase